MLHPLLDDYGVGWAMCVQGFTSQFHMGNNTKALKSLEKNNNPIPTCKAALFFFITVFSGPYSPLIVKVLEVNFN